MSKTSVEKKRLRPANELVPDEQARNLLSVSEANVARARIEELASLIWHHKDADEADIKVGIARAIEQFNSLGPVDGAEAMLATQIVATHSAAVESLRRAAIPAQSDMGRDVSLKHAHKLMTLYARQLATLNKHRGKGQQKVTVEHVNVEKGGQAIVGNVEAGGRRDADAKPPELEHKPDDTVPLANPMKAKTRSRKRR